jgi:hypothetical protein
VNAPRIASKPKTHSCPLCYRQMNGLVCDKHGEMEWCERHGAAYLPGHVCSITPQARRKPGPPRSVSDKDQKRRAVEYSKKYREKNGRKSRAMYPPQVCILCGVTMGRGPGRSLDKKARFCGRHRIWAQRFNYYTHRREAKNLSNMTYPEAEQHILDLYEKQTGRVPFARQEAT